VAAPFSPSHGFIHAEGTCRDESLHGWEHTTQHMTLKFLPSGLDGGKYFWRLALTFRLGEGEDSDKWYLANHTLWASYPKPCEWR